MLDRIGFYTPIAAECAAVKQNRDWLFETEVFGIALSTATGTCPAGTQPLYRLYNNGQGGAPNHRYTTDLAVRSTMTGQGWIPEGNGALGVIGCAATPTRAPDNLLVLRVRAAMLNAPNPTVSVAIDGKTALAPTVVTATVALNSVQEIRLDTTSFEPIAVALEVAAQGAPNTATTNSNVRLLGVSYQGKDIALASGQYDPPRSFLMSNGVALLNPRNKVVFPAAVLPHGP